MGQPSAEPRDVIGASRSIVLELRPDAYIVQVEYQAVDDGAWIVAERYRHAREEVDAQGCIHTINGPMRRDALQRAVSVADTPTDIAVIVRWTADGTLVRNDVHVISKQPSVVAQATSTLP